ncbi:MAG: cobalamin biosynthesis protein P47K [Gemmataceae bacterium]|nr:cobalamin biosynthesis protein P47K [Gemmataceae bacterium]
MHTIRFIMVGGFLGAGKTTTLARLGRHYLAQGLKIGLVTNDQAQDLVDTHLLRQQGFPVEEVAGACFCCKFDELLDKVNALDGSQRPDVVLAEPVGSCTDLVATVIQPLKDLYGARFSVAPYVVLFKPSHGLKILRGDASVGFSPKAAYIFRKQLEEADVVLLNRLDELTPAEADELARLVAAHYPATPLLKVSAKTGAGFDAVVEWLDQQGDFGRRILDIDYDTYAAGEAELGWLNRKVHVQAAQPFALDELLIDVVRQLRAALAGAAAEVAHLKAIGLWEGFFGVANLVTTAGDAVLSVPSRCQVSELDLIVNARVAMDPDELRRHVAEVLARECQRRGATLTDIAVQSFRPGRPTPTHRYVAAV